MKPTSWFFLLLLGFSGTHVFGQYEDLSNVAGSASSKASPVCAIQGIKVAKKDGQKGAKDVSISFQFSSKPSVFFNYYDAQKKAVVFDFYDAHLRKAVVPSIAENPITRSTVDSVQVDLNKDTKGMDADIRDVVRVSLFTPYDFEYDAQSSGSVVSMNFKWSPAKEAELKKGNKGLYWQLPLAAVLLGGAGFAAYEFLKPAETSTDVLGNPPSHP